MAATTESAAVDSPGDDVENGDAADTTDDESHGSQLLTIVIISVGGAMLLGLIAVIVRRRTRKSRHQTKRRYRLEHASPTTIIAYANPAHDARAPTPPSRRSRTVSGLAGESIADAPPAMAGIGGHLSEEWQENPGNAMQAGIRRRSLGRRKDLPGPSDGPDDGYLNVGGAADTPARSAQHDSSSLDDSLDNGHGNLADYDTVSAGAQLTAGDYALPTLPTPAAVLGAEDHHKLEDGYVTDSFVVDVLTGPDLVARGPTLVSANIESKYSEPPPLMGGAVDDHGYQIAVQRNPLYTGQWL